MKTNEAPKKIYLPYKDDRLIGLVKTEGVKFNSGVDGHIEYTRTDAFIEKAISWLKEQNEMIGVSFQEDFLELFQDYMKGE